jgi:hypothetical protein
MAGYSETPLRKKLGIKEGFRVGLVNSPKAFKKETGDPPAGREDFRRTINKASGSHHLVH